jgi:prepilin-type processing-associated H-X9-DG protein
LSQYPPPPQMPGQPYPTQPPPPSGGATGLAITSLILGIVGMCVPLLSIGAIVCGAIGISKTRDPRSGGRGMAIAGLVLGCVGFVFSFLMISILLPSLNKARETANRVKCQSNMSQIGKAIWLYANENNGYPPPRLSLLVTTQDLEVDRFCCPSSNQSPGSVAADADDDDHLSYVYVLTGRHPLNAPGGSHVLLYEKPGAHDGDGMNVLFADGRAEFLRQADADKLLAELSSKRK